jgi:hypothetical protein
VSARRRELAYPYPTKPVGAPIGAVTTPLRHVILGQEGKPLLGLLVAPSGGERVATQTMSVVWVDASGYRGITRLNSVAGAAAVVAAMVAASNADYQETWEGPLTANGAPAPIAATYQPQSARAAMTFICADLTNLVLLLPAPQLTDFLTDGQSVDPASPAIAALIAACIGVLTNAAGSPVTAFVSGVLMAGATTAL